MRIITKKYKLIILGDNHSGKSLFINNLRNNTNSLIQSYNPTDGINFYKYIENKEANHSILRDSEKYENILYMYDSSGSRKKSYFIASYIKTSQICLLVINPNNYNTLKEFEDSIIFWVQLYVNYSDKNSYNLILISINNYDTKTKTNTNTNNTYWKDVFKNDNDFKNVSNVSKYINDLLKKANIYKEIIYLNNYNFRTDASIIIKDILVEIHNFNILKIMTKTNTPINTNLKNNKLYFKKEINYCSIAKETENTHLLNNSKNHFKNNNKNKKTKCSIM